MEGSGERQKPQNHFVGLPTPGECRLRLTSLESETNHVTVNSTELHAQSSPSTDYISPITLDYVDTSHFRSNSQSQLPPDMHLPPHHISVPNEPRTAPADLVFDTTPSMPLPSPGELEFDLSPLSPWMDPYNPDTSQQPRRKRTASPHGEEQVKVARQRPSPTPRVPPTPNSTNRGSRSTKSASSTPLLRSSRARGRKNSTSGDIPGDSPSPVDLSMPPPGAPASQPELNASSSRANMLIANSSPTSATGRAQQQITPVTPASIMNLGGLGMNSGLTPPTHAVKFDGKGGKSAGRGKDSSSSVPTSKKGNGVPLVSPSLKPILPGKSGYRDFPRGAAHFFAYQPVTSLLLMPSPRRPYRHPSFASHHIRLRNRNVVIRSRQRSTNSARYSPPSHCRVRTVIQMSRSYLALCLPVGHLEAMRTAQIGVSASCNSCDVEMTTSVYSKIRLQVVTTRLHCSVLKYGVCAVL
jgi:hypothetical protein